MKNFFLAIMGILLLAGVCLVASRSYPIAFVNWRPITLKSFNKNYDAALSYYKSVLETYNKSQLDVINSSEVKNEIRRAALAQLVENILIERELENQMGRSGMEKAVNDKISESLNGKDISEGIKKLYGLSLGDFKEIILKPQAEKEILAGELVSEGGSIAEAFDNWLKETKGRAKVAILLSGFKWKDSQIILK